MNQQFGAEITRGLVGTLTAGRAVTASSSLAKWERVRGGLPMASPQRASMTRWRSTAQVNMTISLAFLAPDLVRAAGEGRLPRGIGEVAG